MTYHDLNRRTGVTDSIGLLKQVPYAAAGLLLAKLSVQTVINLLGNTGGRQIMNGSFDKFRLVNTYGAFGYVNR